MRLRGPAGGLAVVCVNGGTAREVPGTWSATIEWLVDRLAARLPDVRFCEVRYRVKSWKRLDGCIEDGAEAIDLVARESRPACLLGFSMGGAVAIANAGHPAVRDVVALAPWMPAELDLAPLAGRRLTVVHGQVDGYLPGVPGVSPAHSRAGVARARAIGVRASHEVIPAAMHGTALRAPWGSLVPLPRSGEWLRLVSAAVGRAVQSAAGAAAPAGSGA
ncbi:MAG: hypothetical protein MUE51_04550 [Thermoleophilia bacterium]|nr:hypothetical protein [Thermoleophilia bacterium]